MSNTRIVIALLLLLSGNHVKAQFNTVSCPGNRYKVTVENPTRTTNKAEATPESITSENEKSVPDKVSLSSADTKKKEQVTAVLLLIKEDVDDAFFHNEAIVETPAYFTKNILTYVTRRFKDAQISTERPARKYVSDVIFKEYQTIY